MHTEDKLRDDVRKLLGKPPYNHPTNICWNDNYFARSLDNTYGERAVERMIKEVQQEGRPGGSA